MRWDFVKSSQPESNGETKIIEEDDIDSKRAGDGGMGFYVVFGRSN
jgi:hypothetical protein